MRRFLALAWHAADPAAALAAQELARRVAPGSWPHSACWPGLRVYHNWPTAGPMQVWPLGGPGTALGERAGGFIFGRLFPRRERFGPPLKALSVGVSRCILSSAGQYLIDRYWGAFAALLVDEERVVVLRDPSGAVPVYRWRAERLDVFFSDLADLRSLQSAPLALDWRYLSESLLRPMPHGGRTAFEAVTEVLAGERLQRQRERVTSDIVWDACGPCSDPFPFGIGKAASELRRVTQCSVAAWASVHENILMQLSGGFDSAVVLGCVSALERGPQIHALNRFSDNEDERAYARAAAARAKVPLTEVPWRDSDVRFEARLDELPIAPLPTVPEFLRITLPARQELAERVGAEAAWSGQGGDHLFLSFREPLFVTDHVRQHGWTPETWNVLLGASRLARVPLWQSARAALRARWRPCPVPDAWAPYAEHFASGDVGLDRDAARAQHPWVLASGALPPGKRYQLATVSELVHRHVPMARDERSPELHPLISLPLIELSLSMPTWDLLHGGRSRGLARIAFRPFLPLAVRRRESKGETTAFIAQALRRHAAWIAQVLREGELARAGVLDRRRLEPTLIQGRPLRLGEFAALLACLAAEAWLQGCRPLTVGAPRAAPASARIDGRRAAPEPRLPAARTETTAGFVGRCGSDAPAAT